MSYNIQLTLKEHILNVYYLIIKELRSIKADPIMIILVLYAFSFAVYMVSTGASTEVKNLVIAIVDEDNSELSRRIQGAFLPPLFKQVINITTLDVDRSMDDGKFVFVVNIPPSFQSDILAGRGVSIQLNIDATSMTQAGNGSIFIQNIINNEISLFKQARKLINNLPVKLVIRTKFNPNLNSNWFTSVMQVINNISMLTLILSGAALIREREHGTVEHLLVMPILPIEIMLAKVLANGFIIVIVATLSLKFIVQILLQVPVAGSLLLFLFGSTIYALSVAALGILLATFSTSMGQFGLLAIPILVIMYLLSGSTTPMNSIPIWLCYIMQIISPAPHFVSFAQSVLYRGAGINIVWPQLTALVIIGVVYFRVSLSRFRSVIFNS